MPDPQNRPSTSEQEPNEPVNKPSAAESDQETRPYYYDDAHGYETYDPDSDADDEDEFDD